MKRSNSFPLGILAQVVFWAAIGLSFQSSGQPTSNHLPHFWQTDDSVMAIVVTNKLAYLGGDFKYVGPASGAAGLLDADSGAPLANFPKLDGAVYAVTADGAGGWYVGGRFTLSANPEFKNLVHVLANGKVDGLFFPDPAAAVRALLLRNNVLWVGGEFLTIAGTQTGGFALIDPASGKITGPRVRMGGNVLGMAADGDIVYLVGTFNNVLTFKGNTQVQNPRQRAAAVNTATVELLPWNPGCTGGSGINTIAVNGNEIYLGGNFTQVGSKPRVSIASVNKSDGLVTSWNPGVQRGTSPGDVNGISIVNGVAYVAGNFTAAGSAARSMLAAIPTAGTGQADPSWQADANGEVQFVFSTGTDLLVGGVFTQINSNIRRGFARVSTASGTVTSWGPLLSNLRPTGNLSANCIASDGFTMLLGGDFTSFGGVSRSGLAAISLATGQATEWNPGADLTVLSLCLGSKSLFAGGAFTSIGGVSRPRIAELDLTTGLATSWDPKFGTGQTVAAVAVGPSSVYIGGAFTKVAGIARNFLAELDITTGALTEWDPKPNSQIYALLYHNSLLYVGGNFSVISGTPRTFLALLTSGVKPVDQLVSTFVPKLDGAVRCLVPDASGTTIYVGGDFSKSSNQPRRAIASIDAATGLETHIWDAQITGTGTLRTSAILPVGKSVLFGGQFRSAGGENRGRVAGVGTGVGTANGWDPGADAGVNAIARNGDLILIGGDFTRLGLRGLNPNPNTSGTPVSFLAAFNALPQIESLEHDGSGKTTLRITDGEGVGSAVDVQSTGNLAKPAWTTIKTVEITGLQNPIEDSSGGTASQYYRLVRKP